MARKLKGNTALIWPLVVLIIAFGAFYLKPWQTKPAETISVTAQGKAQSSPAVNSPSPTIVRSRWNNFTKITFLLGNCGYESKVERVFVGRRDY